MIELVVTGGRPGVEQAAWKCAKRHGIKTGGFMPPDFATDEGRRPEFAEEFGAEELHDSTASRMEANLRLCGPQGYALVFDVDRMSTHSRRLCNVHSTMIVRGMPAPSLTAIRLKHVLTSKVSCSEHYGPHAVAGMIGESKATRLMVSGNTHEENIFAAGFVNEYLDLLFRLLK